MMPTNFCDPDSETERCNSTWSNVLVHSNLKTPTSRCYVCLSNPPRTSSQSVAQNAYKCPQPNLTLQPQKGMPYIFFEWMRVRKVAPVTFRKTISLLVCKNIRMPAICEETFTTPSVHWVGGDLYFYDKIWNTTHGAFFGSSQDNNLPKTAVAWKYRRGRKQCGVDDLLQPPANFTWKSRRQESPKIWSLERWSGKLSGFSD